MDATTKWRVCAAGLVFLAFIFLLYTFAPFWPGHFPFDDHGEPKSETSRSEIFFIAEFSLGTPRRLFRGLLSTTTTALAVLTKSYEDRRTYYPNEFSTGIPTNQVEYLEVYYGVSVGGPVVRDTVTFADLKIPNYDFVAGSTGYLTRDLFNEGDIDGFFGLDPFGRKRDAPTHLTSLFMSMVQRGSLDVNCWSLKPPQSTIGAPGELTFGRTSDQVRLEDKFIHLPITNHTIRGDMELPTWQTETNTTVYVGGNSVELNKNILTMFFAESPLIFLPSHAVDLLLDAVGDFEDSLLFYFVECDQRKDFPDLTINFSGNNFTFTPYQYAMEVTIEDSTECILAVQEAGDFIILGSSFLKNYYTVFDWDSKEIKCMPLPCDFDEQLEFNLLKYDLEVTSI
ncbi:Vacuolar protease A [Aspergillus nanangensis]|uniref:Vacuolar protease A n=1 Tax=Aspergillus nanangensis TaxID=2582783 RepID=A0AAD4CQH5_ASPNN|nr:Vacuolar protease A [Aspergillus nanangensis]